MSPSLTSIGDYTFQDCENLTAIALPAGLISVGDYAFLGCKSLASVVCPQSLASIGESAFRNCMALAKLVLPGSLGVIGGHAFHGCATLVTVTLPNSLGALSNGVFANCDQLAEVALPSSLTEVGENAFRNCVTLERVQWSGSLARIGPSAFAGCVSLADLTQLPWSLTSIGKMAFLDCSFRRVVLPNSLVSLGCYAFSECRQLEAVTLSAALVCIEMGTFYCCDRLVDLEVPPSVRTIKGTAAYTDWESTSYEDENCGAFRDCSALRTLVLPPSLTTLGADAFRGSTMLLRLLVLSPSVSPEVAAAMAVMVGERFDINEEFDEVTLPPVSAIALVRAPDAVVAALGGPFAAMTTMAEVPAHRTIVSPVELLFWNRKVHLHNVCTAVQRASARAVMLAGRRLHNQSIRRRRHGWGTPVCDATPPAPAVIAGGEPAAAVRMVDELALPSLPDELWMMVLGWMRRCELGRVREPRTIFEQ
jgi:hypothetical protein